MDQETANDSLGRVPVSNSPQDFEALIGSEIAKWSKLIGDAAFKPG